MKTDNVTLRGLVSGMEDEGAKFIKLERDSIHFEIPKNGILDNKEKLQLASWAFEELLSLKLRIKKV